MDARYFEVHRVAARADAPTEPDHATSWLPAGVAMRRVLRRSHAWAIARFAMSPVAAIGRDARPPTHVRAFTHDDAPACEAVLRALPEWFGIEEALRGYVEALDRPPARVAERDGSIVGFVQWTRAREEDAEIHVLAVRPECRGSGVGHALLVAAEAALSAEGVRTLRVKTLGPSRPDAHYARTRSSYERWGFFATGESRREWGPENPCLTMEKSLER